MSRAKRIRLQYGFTQQQLAQYLGIAKGLLSMAELGKRTLPTAALIKLASIQQLPAYNNAAGTSKKITERLSTQQAAAAKTLQTHALKCTADAAAAMKKLTGLEKKFNQAMGTLTLVSQLRQLQAGNGTVAKKDILWQNMVEAIAVEKLHRCGAAAQQLLRIKIASLQQQADHAKNAAINFIQKD
jgi:transcriptional regulator with XRE-family HTH domain